jgi:hypothetical protein
MAVSAFLMLLLPSLLQFSKNFQWYQISWKKKNSVNKAEERINKKKQE